MRFQGHTDWRRLAYANSFLFSLSTTPIHRQRERERERNARDREQEAQGYKTAIMMFKYLLPGTGIYMSLCSNERRVIHVSKEVEGKLLT